MILKPRSWNWMTVQIDKGRIDIEKMRTEIDKTRIDIEKMRAEMRLMERWEPWKALAALALGVAALSGAIIGFSHLIRP